MANLLRDARFGFRLLLKNPGFAVVAVAALALGIAVNTVMFSVIYPTYFEPLPYRDADRLVMVWSRLQGERIPVSPGDFRDWKRQATVFEDLNAWNGVEVNLATGDRPELALAGLATPGFLTMFGYGQPLALGRNFLEEEGISGRDQVAIVTHRIWQERFGGPRGLSAARSASTVGLIRSWVCSGRARPTTTWCSCGCRSLSRPSDSIAPRAGCT